MARGYHNCADGSDGKLYGWGFGYYGQSDGDQYSGMKAVEVPAPEGVTLSGASAGALHTCAEGSDGKLYCWGENLDGQLGNGTTTRRFTAVEVQAPEGVTLSGVVTGGHHTCASGSDGKLYCWGHNPDGQTR